MLNIYLTDEIKRKIVTAFPSEGESFKVALEKRPGMPPLVICTGKGIDCPFNVVVHSTFSGCDLTVDGQSELLCRNNFFKS